MRLLFDLTSVITIIGIFTGLFLSLLLFTCKTGNTRANRVFGLLIMAVALSIVNPGIGMGTDILHRVPHLIGVSLGFVFFMGPLYYLYFKFITDQSFSFSALSLAHFILAPLYFIIKIDFFMMTGNEKIIYRENLLKGSVSNSETIINITISAILFIHVLGYMLYTKYRLKQYKMKIGDSFSKSGSESITWLITFGNLFITSFITFLILNILISADIITYGTAFRILPVSITLLLCIAAYKALQQQSLFVPSEILKSPGNGYSDGYRKKIDPEIPEDKLTEMTLRLTSYMESEHPYKNPDLTLPQLSKTLDIPRYSLSYLINRHIGLPFYDYINRYRVNEAIKAIESKQTDNLLHIAYQAGFSNKSTFNKFFKKQTGKTPSQYKKEL